MNEDDLEEKHYLFKILVIGEPSVGKTSLIRRYCSGNFTDKYKSTIGVDFLQKEIQYNKNTTINLHFWDIAGQERIGSQINILFRDTHGVICLFDVANDSTKAQVAAWKQLVNERVTMHGEPYKPPCVLIANKIDLVCETSHDFDTTEIDALSEQLEFDMAFPMSIKGNYNIENMMNVMIKMLIKADENIAYKEETDLIMLQEIADHEVNGLRSYCTSSC